MSDPDLVIDVSLHDGVESPVTETTWHTWFQLWWQQLAINVAGEISVHLTNDAEIQALNSQFRHKDAPTDVLAFVTAPLAIAEGEDLPQLLGDIVISVDTAAAQAAEQQHSLTVELAWLASHGLLHLLGWDHPDPESLEAMLKQQRQLLEVAHILTEA